MGLRLSNYIEYSVQQDNLNHFNLNSINNCNQYDVRFKNLQHYRNFNIRNSDRHSTSSSNSVGDHYRSVSNNITYYNINTVLQDSDCYDAVEDDDMENDENEDENVNFNSRLYNSTYNNSSLHKNKKIRLYKFGCRNCRIHLSSSLEILSKDYRGKTGDAYLMNNVINVLDGEQEKRLMITGDYVVCNINCQLCKKCIGWKYLISDSADQKYKEGKYILELKRICLVD